MIRYNLLLAFTLLAASRAEARPYYAAMKGMSCAACHIAPAGGGMRKSHEGSPGRITDTINVGADLRVYLSQTEKAAASGTTASRSASNFNTARSALYISAEPQPGLTLLYNTDNSQTAQTYGMWQAQEGLPYYVRAGRFFLPYGIQWDDIDHLDFIHAAPFAPNVGFNMAPTQSDTGVEFGLAPKKEYFVNIALTNGLPNGGGEIKERKALTGRAGWIGENFMVGGTFYGGENKPITLSPGTRQLRYGPIAWFKVNRAVLMYEGGFGSDTPKGGTKTKMTAHAVELDFEPAKRWMGKARADIIDPNTTVPNDDKTRYTVSVERIFDNVSCELAYRIIKETPSVKNNQLLLAGHLWF